MKVEVEDRASGPLKELAERLGDLSPFMQSFGRHMMVSVRSNFLQGGRPEKWDELKNVIVMPKGTRRGKGDRRRIQGSARQGGPLVLSGNLKDSITFIAEPADLVLTTSADLDPTVKGPVHQWGTDRAGRLHNIAIPARPFLVFQSEDIKWFRNAALGWIRTGKVPQ